MAKLLKLRRGTTSQHSSFTGAEGEVTIDTTKDTAVVHDGSQTGGRPLAREDLNNVSSSTITGRLSNGSIASAKIAGDAIDGTKLADNACNSEHYTDGSIDHVHLSGDCVDGDNIANDSINSEHYVDGSIDEAHLANSAVTSDKLNNSAVTFAKFQNVAQNHILGRISSGTGALQQLSASSIRSILNVANGATNVTNNNQISNGAGYVTSSGNTVIGTDSDINTSGATVVDQLNMTDGVITSHSTRTLTLANLGYTGATNANYITNNNQLSNGAGYITSFTNNYMSGVSFNTGNGVLTFSRSGLGNITVDIDGRFLPLSGGTLTNTLNARHIYPSSNNTYDLGSSSYRWRNLYTNDLNLSNEGSSNDVDGTWGDWTIQEGESDLFLKNNRSGKKYKFNLTEVS